MAESIMLNMADEFAVNIVNFCKILRSEKVDWVLLNQLMRSGTSVGANIHESKYAQSKADFISKMQIALKECYESEYWMELLYRTDNIKDEKLYKRLLSRCSNIKRMLIASINTTKEIDKNNLHK